MARAKQLIAGASMWFCIGVLVIATTGCPSQPVKATVLLSGDNGMVIPTKGGEVSLDAIQSLTVTVTEVSLDVSGAVEDATESKASEGEGEGEAETPGKVVVFSGEKRVDLRDLTGISEVISTASLEPGTYTKIRLGIKDPELVLVEDPSTVITDIQLTANAHLFVSDTFVVPEGQVSLIKLDFAGIHLVQTGQGKCVWTPQLRASIEVSSAEVLVSGTIQSVNEEALTLDLAVADSDSVVQVSYGSAQVYLPEDTDTATGSPADLSVGVPISLEGLMDVYGNVTASVIRVEGS